MFNLTSEQLNTLKATHTAQEIYQQPNVWREMVTDLFQEKPQYDAFLEGIKQKHGQVRVIFTGAGTSAFAGDTVAPMLRQLNDTSIQFESIATTDIVSNPEAYLLKDVPTIMVSFARSGNSPESVAAVTLGTQIIDDFYQIIITCNKDGKLAKNVQGDDNSLLILTPEKAHDQGFAMTSSFTSMMIAAYGVFTTQAESATDIDRVIENGKQVVNDIADVIDDIVAYDFERIVFLGSGLLGQLAHEASLKMLELTSGKVVAVHESSLGFRHGPKTILNDTSVVVIFMSQDPYTRKYDLDILRELATDGSPIKLVVVDEQKDAEVEKLADWLITVNKQTDALSNDFTLALLYVIFAQALALKTSIKLGITPDNPSPDGRVNRVVKGVTIYPWH
ncbi:SIS domain-containing protein [Lentibacillus saliphilus]|uniref:SIS domain-containing protein n=1 Tax=Lentibacillus saliphilus TaxID=2737028 RepID=UPI001C303495|nr:SIS domain-containing protein [Lentibacillus saliphilus]